MFDYIVLYILDGQKKKQRIMAMDNVFVWLAFFFSVTVILLFVVSEANETMLGLYMSLSFH